MIGGEIGPVVITEMHSIKAALGACHSVTLHVLESRGDSIVQLELAVDVLQLLNICSNHHRHANIFQKFNNFHVVLQHSVE